MNSLEKLAYLKGLVEGLGLDETKKDTKVINNLITLLEDVVLSVTSLEEGFAEMQQQIDAVDEDLGEVEKDLYEDDDECDCCKGDKDSDADDIYYEVTCPTCGDTIHLDDELISMREIDCPNCGEKLEFDLEG
ncbi:MAG: hypothetical protein E7554_07005 [Ruminococcaceae bacterium]|nr:hypothetical protein [Oscillospiraceae bacterium]